MTTTRSKFWRATCVIDGLQGKDGVALTTTATLVWRNAFVVALQSAVVFDSGTGVRVLPSAAVAKGFAECVSSMVRYRPGYAGAVGVAPSDPFRLHTGIVGLEGTVLGLPENASRPTSRTTFDDELHFAVEVHDGLDVQANLVEPFLDQLWGLYEVARSRFVRS